MSDDAKIEELYRQFERGFWMKITELENKFKFISAINAYHYDSPPVLNFRAKNQDIAASFFDGRYLLKTENIENIFSFFACGKSIEIKEDCSEFLKGVFQLFLGQLPFNKEFWVDDLLKNQSKSGEWGNLIEYEWLAARILMDSYIDKVLKDSSFRLKKNMVVQTINFNSNLDKAELKVLWSKILKGYLQPTTSFESFYTALTQDWGTHKEKIQFRCKTVEACILLHMLEGKFENFEPTDIGHSQVFISEKGNLIKSGNINSSLKQSRDNGRFDAYASQIRDLLKSLI